MDDLLQEFLTETAENLDIVDQQLVVFEQNPHDKDIVNNIFRLVHTIKGTCGFLDLPRLEAVAHSTENLLGKFRDDEISVTPDKVSLVLESLDHIKELLAFLEDQGVEPQGDDAELIERLEAAQRDEDVSSSTTAAQVQTSRATGQSRTKTADEDTAQAEAQPDASEADSAEDEAAAAEDSKAEPAEAKAPAPEPEPEPAPAEAKKEPAQTKTSAEPGKADTAKGSEPAKDDKAKQGGGDSAPYAHKKAADTAGKQEPRASQQTIRVSVDVLESLMTTVSELVLIRNQLLQMVRDDDDSEFKKPLERLSAITTDLQDGVMKTRMQPIGNAWQKLPRIVRDAQQDLGKKIHLKMEGEEVELDRQVSELIRDPLTHMIRNACDHGLETTEERKKAGKPEEGTIRLRAYHEGGQIIIELIDDGKGLNSRKIRDKALERGVITQDEAESMSETALQKLIFAPGFSTADQVTSISGRGVGMDVVRTNIELIGGSVDLRSVEGQGTTFMIKIPLTLAIVSSLIVRLNGERFAVPQLAVRELVRAGGRKGAEVDQMAGAYVMRLRDRLLPLVDLRALLWKGERTVLDGEKAVFVVVMQVGAQRFGVIVDEVFDTEEIVVKPVATVLRHIKAYSGNTILGDGSVIMILDPNGIASSVATDQDQLAQLEAEAEEQAEQVAKEDRLTSLLTFRAGSKEPKAVPLSLIKRLEEIDANKIESSMGGHVVQYGDGLIPVLYAGRTGGIRTEGEQPMLIFSDEGHSMGLAVDEILDVAEVDLDIELASAQPGVLGSAVIKERATEVLDVSYYLKKAFRDWFRRASRPQEGRHRRILLVDDNDFYRNMVTPMLKVAGFDVVGAESVDEAWRHHDKGARFDAIVSDIEMPGTNGFEFAKRVRSDEHWKDTPIIAVSAIDDEDYQRRGREAGFIDYVPKSDGERLMAALSEATTHKSNGAGAKA